MKLPCFVLLIACVFNFLLSFSIQAQEIENSRRSSYYTFIYKISNQEAEELYKDPDIIDRTFLHNLFDYFPTDSTYDQSLPMGHYLFVKTINEQVHYVLESVNNLDLQILNNHRDLMLALYTREGSLVEDAHVQIKKRSIPYEEDLKVYRLSKTNKRGLLTVDYQGHRSFFVLHRQLNNTFIARTVRKIIGTFPLNHLLSPVFYLKKNVVSLVRYGYVSPPGIYHRVSSIFSPPSYKGYIVFNKPKYKPADSVYVKAFITTEKGKPIDKKARLVLYQYAPAFKRTEIGEITPTFKGSYHFQFKLSDSLNLQLNRNYTIKLEDEKQHTLIQGSFTYEQYELNQNEFTLRADNKVIQKPAILYLQGKDANNMPLYDIRAKVLVKTDQAQAFYQDKVFIADTLWEHEISLDPLGETKLALPDSIFPGASLKYHVEVTFLSSDNERQLKNISLEYNPQAFPLKIDFEKDSLSINYWKGLKTLETPARLIHLIKGDTIKDESIQLPYRAAINPLISHYALIQQGQIKVFPLENEDSGLSFAANRTVDSLKIVSQNPRKLQFRYFLFKNNKLLEKGSGEELKISRKTKPAHHYALSIQYIWAGEAREQEYQIPLDSRELSIELDQPDFVYPGQVVDLQVQVKDMAGRPLKDVDLTAYATTSKFKFTGLPSLPEYPQKSKGRTIFNEFTKVDPQYRFEERIEWDYWRTELGLDSIAFYKFLYPEKGFYKSSFPTEQAISQVAPFVVKNGRIQAVHVIYIDSKPVYYKNIQTFNPYSFSLTAGIPHTIGLRLSDSFITIRDVILKQGEKLIFSIDKQNLPESAHMSKLPAKFTKEEINELSRYFVPIKRQQGQELLSLKQDSTYYLFKPAIRRNYNWYSYSNSEYELAGPFNMGKLSIIKDPKEASNTFQYEPFYSYELDEGLLKMKEFPTARYFQGYLFNAQESPNLNDRVLTEGKLENYWEQQQLSPISYYHYYPTFDPVKEAGGRLALKFISENTRHIPIKAFFLMSLEDPNVFYILSDLSKLNMPIKTGVYQLVLIYGNEQYQQVDSISVRENGLNYYDVSAQPLLPPDTFSTKILNTIEKWSFTKEQAQQILLQDMRHIREELFKQSQSLYGFEHEVRGQITSVLDGEPIPGVNVIIKGTSAGTVTDMDGRFRIMAPPNGTLIFAFIGFVSKEVDINSQSFIQMSLEEDVKQLQEVVVTGFGSTGRHVLRTTNILQGKIAGVNVAGSGVDEAVLLRVRGLATMPPQEQPLLILDGRIVPFEQLDPKKVQLIEILKGAEASALYGARAANGVILISSSKEISIDELRKMVPPALNQPKEWQNTEGSGTGIRQNFRDYAFWQPALRTDEYGQANFKVSFPDDITGWNTFVIGMDGNKRTGSSQGFIQSYKPVMAQLSMPHFLLEGDSAVVYGKITNYENDSITVQQQIAVDDNAYRIDTLKIKNSYTQSVAVSSQNGNDSLKVEYSLRYNDYQDGEIRRFPVYPIGSLEATGMFLPLERDTTFTINFSSEKEGPLQLLVKGDMLEVMLDEIDYVKSYPYGCNEQEASRLLALLLEKEVRHYRKENFKSNRAIERSIKKLIAQQNSDGSWGWWAKSTGSPWISLHVAKALRKAEKAGYRVSYDRDAFFAYVAGLLGRLKEQEKLQAMVFMAELQEKVSESEFANSVLKNPNSSLYNRLLAQKYLVLTRGTADISWLDTLKNETIMGNVYWGEDDSRLFDNAIQNSLIVYEIKEHLNSKDPDLVKIRSFLLESKDRNWRNTYESSQILTTILPGLMNNAKQEFKPASLKISGSINEEIYDFPYKKEIPVASSIQLKKEGTSTLYFTAYQQNWNANPEAVDKDFEIQTSFNKQSKYLKAGEAVILVVRLKVRRDAEYIMIEVPIPAGCTYSSKRPGAGQEEVHREYYYHQTNIYCQYLPKGEYIYTIELSPRFSGSFTLNPAKVSSMYFPTIYGRNELKQIKIE